MSKVVFVGNVPYNMGEEQLIKAFRTVGQVVGFRLVFDRDTGKPKGYGFCEFADHDTALSAVRNLNGQEIGGRSLRIDLADSDPFLEGKTTIRGELVGASETRAHWRERTSERAKERNFSRSGRGHGADAGRGGSLKSDTNTFLAKLPRGVLVPAGSTASESISNLLARESPSQILEVLAHMKAFAITRPEHAKALLVAHPQLGYALFEALQLYKLVDDTTLKRMLSISATATAVPPSAPVASYVPASAPMAYKPAPSAMQYPQPECMAPPSYFGGPLAVCTQISTLHGGAPLQNLQGMAPPAQLPPYYPRPPPQAMQPPPQQVMSSPQQPPSQEQEQMNAARYDAPHRDLLVQVLALTQEQIDTLPPTEREQIMTLRKHLGSGRV